MAKCEAVLFVTRYVGIRKYLTQRCTEEATETRDGHAVCWLHGTREDRIAKFGFTKDEIRSRLHIRRFVDGTK
jgi:hypothetical protein